MCLRCTSSMRVCVVFVVCVRVRGMRAHCVCGVMLILMLIFTPTHSLHAHTSLINFHQKQIQRNKRPLPSPPVSSPNLKLTKSESMLRLRKSLKHYSSSCLLSRNDKFKFRFVEGINELTFQDDERFRDENIFFSNVETIAHKHVRDLGCRRIET